jgi:hypothetical protein
MSVLAEFRPRDASAVFSELRDLWRRLKGARTVPSKTALGAEVLRPWLPNILIVELLEQRFRFRLVGTAIVTAIGRDLTGAYFDEVSAPVFYPSLAVPYDRARQTAEPVEYEVRHGLFVVAHELQLRPRQLILPCSKFNGDIDTFVSCIVPEAH